MSDFTRRVVDGIGSLMSRARADETPLSHVAEAELESELRSRKAAGAGSNKPEDNPHAKWAGAGKAARDERTKAAELREKKVHAARDKRDQADKKAHEEAFKQARAQADRAKQVDFEAWKRATAGGTKSAGSSSSRGGFGFGIGKDETIAKYYKTLDLPYGAELDEVKKAYRLLMRKYHPDMHRGSEKKLKAATELSMQVTAAYKGLEKHIKGK